MTRAANSAAPDELAHEVRECAEWRAEHDGRINAFWKQQFTTNDKVEARLTALERRVLVLSTLAAAAGGIIGQVAQKLFGG